jgi:hypothetical protein
MSGIEEASGFEVMQLELALLQTWLLNSGLGLSILVSGLPWLEASKDLDWIRLSSLGSHFVESLHLSSSGSPDQRGWAKGSWTDLFGWGGLGKYEGGLKERGEPGSASTTPLEVSHPRERSTASQRSSIDFEVFCFDLKESPPSFWSLGNLTSLSEILRQGTGCVKGRY